MDLCWVKVEFGCETNSGLGQDASLVYIAFAAIVQWASLATNSG